MLPKVVLPDHLRRPLERVMTIEGIDAQKSLAICRYFDDFPSRNIRLECARNRSSPTSRPPKQTIIKLSIPSKPV